ncbi:MAG: vWA domain-containing protein [Myxococcota bacterium]
MNRTTLFLATAGGLALLALVAGLPRLTSTGIIPLDPVRPTTTADGSIKMQGRLSHPYVGTGRSDVFVTVDLTGVDVPGSERSPVSLGLVIDRSGSMSGFKMTQAKNAAKQLVSQLGPSDRLAIIHYGSDVKSLPSQPATPPNKERMLRYIDGIWDDGGTNIGAGLSAGRDHLMATMSEYKVNRLILISDGQPTEGVTDQAGLTSLAREIRQSGISVSSIGVGSDFNEDLMQAIAELGAGAYGYLQDASQLATLFQKDLQQAGTTIARSVVLSFDLPQGVALSEVLGYRTTQMGRTVRVPLSDFSAGQVERVVARLTVNAPEAGQTFDVTSLELSYDDLLKSAPVESSVRLSAMVADKEEQILAHRDKDATVFAARAQSANNMHKAAEALKRGDRAAATGYLRANEAIFGAAAHVAGEGAVAEDLLEQKAVISEFDKADSDEAVQQSVKATKSRSLKNFGRIGSTY